MLMSVYLLGRIVLELFWYLFGLMIFLFFQILFLT
jgi:hypothetical protein